MIDGLIDYYLWIKAAHLIVLISWMAGIFYLPRLFVYHTQVEVGSDQDKLFQTMERKLLRVIMNPAMILTWVFGLMLFFIPGIINHADLWVSVKLLCVFAMTGFHMALAKWRRMFAEGNNQKSENFFRKANEIPTLLMIIIVVMVVVKPF